MRLRFTQASLDEVWQYSVAEIGEIIIIVEEAECAAAEAGAMDLDQTFGNLFRGADQGISSVPHRHSVTDKRQGVVRNRLRMSKLQAYELVDRFVVDHITHELRGVVSRLLLFRRSEESRVGTEGVSTCRHGWGPSN